MNNVLGDALQKALNAKKNDFSSFVWKGEKRPSIKQPKGALPPYSIALF